MTYLKKTSFSPKETQSVETSPSKQNNFTTSSWVDVTYSEISFIPSLLDTYILYENIFWMGKDGTSGDNKVNLKLRLMKNDGSGWVEFGGNTQVYIGSTHSDKRFQSMTPVRFLLESWGSTELSLKLQGRKVDGDIRLHATTHFYGDSGSVSSESDRLFFPQVICRSVY